eukprot:12559364-Ditylum_brightwellii.AAC.1
MVDEFINTINVSNMLIAVSGEFVKGVSFQLLMELLTTVGQPMIVTFFQSNSKNEWNHVDLSSEPALVNRTV